MGMNDSQKSVSLILDSQYSELKPKLDYVMNTFNSLFMVNKYLSVNYGVEGESGINIIPGEIDSFFSNKQEIPDYSYCEWEGHQIPVLFVKKGIHSIISKTQKDKIVINGDILLSAFYFLSCWQEYISNDCDSMGRFPLKESLLFKLGLIQIPVVNYYFDILVKAIESIPGAIVSVNPKHSEGLKVGITHDIDHCQTGSWQDGYRQIRAGEWWNGIKKWGKRIYEQDLWFNFDQLLKIEKELNVTSSYYFIAEKKRKNGYPNADYDFTSSKIQQVVEKIKNAGHEVGIHGSIGTGFDEVKLTHEINQFPQSVIGGRFHYLMTNNPDSFDVIEKSSLLYDSSLGFAEHIGFRNGFCFPYSPYDFENDKPYSFLEFPFQMMDKTLIQPYYMGLKPEDAIQSVKSLIDEINKFSGYFIFIWHNNTITGFKYNEWKRVLLEIIMYCKNINSVFKPISKFKD
jgi:hypothetical protein